MLSVALSFPWQPLSQLHQHCGIALILLPQPLSPSCHELHQKVKTFQAKALTQKVPRMKAVAGCNLSLATAYEPHKHQVSAFPL